MAAATVRFCRTDPAASPPALVAAWLMDALGGPDSVRLSCSEAELIQFEVTEDGRPPVRSLALSALSEARFAGWEVDPE